jgi:hypothetical protein
MVTRSNLKGRPCLTIEQLEFIALRSGGQCEVSGIQFHLGANALHPFQPSVDRVNSDIGYEIENVRFVCLAVNYCMSRWGEQVFGRIAAATVSKRLGDLAAVDLYSAETGEKRNKGGRPRASVSI